MDNPYDYFVRELNRERDARDRRRALSSAERNSARSHRAFMKSMSAMVSDVGDMTADLKRQGRHFDRLRKGVRPSRSMMLKSLEGFKANVSAAFRAGQISGDEASRLEARRIRLAGTLAAWGLI